MAIVLATERPIVRRMCGNPDTTEVSNDDIDSIYGGEALDWINERRPDRLLSSFTTVASQQDYDVKPAAAYKVTEVWWLDTDYDVFSPEMKMMPSAMELDTRFTGFSMIDNPALVKTFYKKLRDYHGTFTGRGFETSEGKIRLEPYPSNAGDTVYFEYTAARYAAITSLDVEFKVGVRFFVAANVMRILSLKRGKIRSTRNFTGGGGQRETDLMNSFFTSADSYVPILASAFYRG